MKDSQNVLLQAATGAGKTIIFSAMARQFVENWNFHTLILAHREQLVRQAAEKLLKTWPEGAGKIGLACSSVCSAIELEKPIVIGSPQTLARHLGELPAQKLLIVDECHRLPPQNKKSQYRDLINRLREYDPEMRMLGVTATPYRLGHGYIYGEDCRNPDENWFSKLSYCIGIEDLQDSGYLAPLKGYGVAEPDLTGVHVSKGEYSLGELSDTMSDALNVGSAVEALRKYGEGRQHVVVFAVTIQHAEILRQAFERAGYRAGAVHSEMAHAERQKVLNDFDGGRLNVICNVGVLTEGWDCTSVDCMIMCRPTKSTALFVQMVGRGLRTHPGKTDCLLLDLSGNWKEHGSPLHPCVRWKQKGNGKEQERKGAAVQVVPCIACHELIPAASLVCPHCHEIQKVVLNRLPAMEALKGASTAPQKVRIFDKDFSPAFTSRNNNHFLRIDMKARGTEDNKLFFISEFLDFNGEASRYGKTKARQIWQAVAHTTPPETLNEAAYRLFEFQRNFPAEVWIRKKDKYFHVVRWN